MFLIIVILNAFDHNFFFSRETDKYSIIWTILFILVLATVLNIHQLFKVTSMTGLRLSIAYIFVTSVIPSILLIVFGTIIYKRLKGLLTSGFFNSGANAQLQKTVFRAKITLSINLIFICNQVLLWINLVQSLVSVH